jgi:hypothetical protein
MKTHEPQSKHARHDQRSRRLPARNPVQQIHWIGQLVLGVVPRSWPREAANDPKA